MIISWLKLIGATIIIAISYSCFLLLLVVLFPFNKTARNALLDLVKGEGKKEGNV